MITNTSFTPNPNIQPYSFKANLLKVEDSKGTTLFMQAFETKEALDKEFYNLKSSRRQTNNKIIEMISNDPDAFHALSEGRVVVKMIAENFSHIQPGIIHDKPVYQAQGRVTEAFCNVEIMPGRYGDNTKKRGGWVCVAGSDYGVIDGYIDENEKSMFRAFLSLEHGQNRSNSLPGWAAPAKLILPSSQM